MKYKTTKRSSIIKRNTQSHGVYERIRKIIENVRGNIVRAINTEMVSVLECRQRNCRGRTKMKNSR